MRLALIVVDVQNDFGPGGSLPVPESGDVGQEITSWIASDGGLYELIVATMDWHPRPQDRPEFDHFSDTPDYVGTWPPHCVEGTRGAALQVGLSLPERAIIVRKGQDAAAYSGFEGRDGDGSTLAEILERARIDHVDVVGLATDYCVKATALDARDLGLGVRVLCDMVAGVAPDTTAQALDEMREVGISIVD